MSFNAALRTYRLNRLVSNTCIGTAVGVFGAWNYSRRGIVYNFLSRQDNALRSVLPSLPSLPHPQRVQNTLTKYFLLKSNDESNYASWIGSAVSHIELWHLAFNLLTWSNFAPALYMLPTSHFTTLIFGSAIASSAAWLYQQKSQNSSSPGSASSSITRSKDVPRSALGSSGIVSGLLATVTMFAPTARVALFGIIQMPLWVSFAGYIFVDTYMMQSERSRIGHSAHLGGSAFGILYYTILLRRFGGILGKRV